MDGCIFCKIANRDAPFHEIWTDDLVVAFLDLQPINPGHVLVIPRQHQASLFDLDEPTYSHLMLVVKRLAGVVKEFARPRTVGLVVAGWDVAHAHIHVVPMHEYHDITSKSILDGTRPSPGDAELAAVARSLQRFLEDSRT